MSTLVTSVYGRGTPGYRAPELLPLSGQSKYSKRSDIWALGCIIHELSTGRPAFSDDYSVIIYANASPDLPVEISFDCKFWQHHISEFLRDLLHKDAELRPNAESASGIISGYAHLSDFGDSNLLPANEVYVSYPEYKRTACSRHEDRLQFLLKVLRITDRHVDPEVVTVYGRDLEHRIYHDELYYDELVYGYGRAERPARQWWLRLVDEMIIASWYSEAALVHPHCFFHRPTTEIKKQYIWLWTTHWPMRPEFVADLPYWALHLSKCEPRSVWDWHEGGVMDRNTVLEDYLLMSPVMDLEGPTFYSRPFGALYIGETMMSAARILFEGETRLVALLIV
jgi:Protein kinase domain